MSYALAGLVLVGAICVVDLMLTVGVIRRLREHSNHLEFLLAGRAGGPQVGSPVPAVSTITIDGSAWTSAELGESAVVGFFAPGCQPCAEQLPAFIRRASGSPGRAIAVIVAGPDGPAELEPKLRELRPVADVILEPPGGPVSQAFGVSFFPTMVEVTRGIITAAGSELPTPDPTVGATVR